MPNTTREIFIQGLKTKILLILRETAEYEEIAKLGKLGGNANNLIEKIVDEILRDFQKKLKPNVLKKIIIQSDDKIIIQSDDKIIEGIAEKMAPILAKNLNTISTMDFSQKDHSENYIKLSKEILNIVALHIETVFLKPITQPTQKPPENKAVTKTSITYTEPDQETKKLENKFAARMRNFSIMKNEASNQEDIEKIDLELTELNKDLNIILQKPDNHSTPYKTIIKSHETWLNEQRKKYLASLVTNEKDKETRKSYLTALSKKIKNIPEHIITDIVQEISSEKLKLEGEKEKINIANYITKKYALYKLQLRGNENENLIEAKDRNFTENTAQKINSHIDLNDWLRIQEEEFEKTLTAIENDADKLLRETKPNDAMFGNIIKKTNILLKLLENTEDFNQGIFNQDYINTLDRINEKINEYLKKTGLQITDVTFKESLIIDVAKKNLELRNKYIIAVKGKNKKISTNSNSDSLSLKTEFKQKQSEEKNISSEGARKFINTENFKEVESNLIKTDKGKDILISKYDSYANEVEVNNISRLNYWGLTYLNNPIPDAMEIEKKNVVKTLLAVIEKDKPKFANEMKKISKKTISNSNILPETVSHLWSYALLKDEDIYKFKKICLKINTVPNDPEKNFLSFSEYVFMLRIVKILPTLKAINNVDEFNGNIRMKNFYDNVVKADKFLTKKNMKTPFKMKAAAFFVNMVPKQIQKFFLPEYSPTKTGKPKTAVTPKKEQNKPGKPNGK